MAIERPVKLYDFSAVQVAPAYEIDRQFDNHRRSIDGLIRLVAQLLRADGKLNNDLLTPESFPKDVLANIEAAALRDAQRAQTATHELLTLISTRQTAIEKTFAELRALIHKNMADNIGVRALGAEVQASRAELKQQLIDATEFAARHAPSPTGTPFPNFPLLGPNAGGFYAGDVEGATATAADYAQVAIEWSEHMPDTIPPNILAINAITGEHWSSRWWAMKSANAFGMMSMLYCGASDVPPIETLTGDPLVPGCIYFDTNTNTMQVWNGSAWQPFTVPQKAFTASLYYLATSGQQHFPLSTPDLYNNIYTLNQQDTEGVECYVNGARLTPDNNPGMLTGDFFTSAQNNWITLAQPLPAGAMVAIDILQTASQLAPGAVAIKPCVNINTPPGFQDGSRTNFVLTVKSDSTHPNLAGPEELLVSIDGVIQEPAVQYQASADSITFLQAPTADAYVFISWFKTPLNNP